MRSFNVLLVLLLGLASVTTPAFAQECQYTVKISLEADTDHTDYKTHAHDVAQRAKEHRFVTRDSAPVWVNVHGGLHCFDFDSLRLFETVMGPTGIIVRVRGKVFYWSLNMDVSDFQVHGLVPGDDVRIEFIQPFSAPKSNHCTQRTDSGWVVSGKDGEPMPMVTYDCDIETMTWKVVEQRTYIMPSETTE